LSFIAPVLAWKLSDMDSSEIKRLGRYEIVGELGRGAMGVVYKARDPQIDRLVALKTVSLLGLEPEQEQEFRERFCFEAKAAGRLHHPSIVTIFDVGEEPESREPYIVLEYVVGESLNRILARQKKLPLSTALQLAEEVADALDYAHAHGVVHRDIKPANILITKDGHAKIADFGIAKLNLGHLTLPGRILGTPAYMAPEQLSGEGVDGRSDLFSLGVILYAMVTGHSPFQGNSATTVCFKVVNREPVPATSLDMELPHSLDAIIARAMAKDPAERYQRGSEFAADLRQLREQSQPASTTASTWSVAASAASGSRKSVGSHHSAPAGLVGAEWMFRTAIARATRKDLILAATAVLALIVLGVPTRKAANSQRAVGAATTTASGFPVPGSQPNAETTGLIVPNVPSAPANPAPASPALPNPMPKGAPSGKTSSVKLREASSHQAPKLGFMPSKPVIVPSSALEISVQHQFKEATLWVWVDDKLALTRPLHGETQKRMGIFSSTRGSGSETLQVPAGTHILRLRTQTADQSIDLVKTVSATFIGGDDKTLQVSFDKHNTAIRLSWQ